MLVGVVAVFPAIKGHVRDRRKLFIRCADVPLAFDNNKHIFLLLRCGLPHLRVVLALAHLVEDVHSPEFSEAVVAPVEQNNLQCVNSSLFALDTDRLLILF